MHATVVGDVDMNPCDASISGLAMTVRQVNDENSAANVSHDPGPHGRAGIDGWRQRHASVAAVARTRSEGHTSELQSLMRNSYAVFCLQKKTHTVKPSNIHTTNNHD